MNCPKCKTENENTRETCKNCGVSLKTINTSRMASFIPLDTPGRAGNYTRDDFINVTAGTELWKKVGWKGAFILLLFLGITGFILFIISFVIN